MLHLHRLQQVVSVPYYNNLTCSTLGLDSLHHCFNVNHFKNWPGGINYQFNEIGFRTRSINEFTGKEILVIGDSFSLGLGCNQSQCWPSVLENLLQYPVLNFSLNGASNDWMARKVQQLLEFFTPRAILFHHTFSHRRERDQPDWKDDERTECNACYTSEENFKNLLDNLKIIQTTCQSIPTIHGFVSKWHDQNVDYSQFKNYTIPPIDVVDLARDGFHYGPITHKYLAQLYATNLLDVESHLSLES
jgi:hypothetical protein